MAMLGLSHEAILEKTLWELGFLGDRLASQDSFLELQQEGYVRYDDLPLRGADGRPVHVEFVSNIYMADRKRVIQCNIRDITERKQAHEKMERQLEELQRWQDVVLGHQDRVDELKREVNELCRRAGEVLRYPSQEDGPANSEASSP
jgi:PAS domain S-box-containing protein